MRTETERLRECLRVLGPAVDEEGFHVRRHIASALCGLAILPWLGRNLRCDPRTGDMDDPQRAEILAAFRADLGPCEFAPSVSCSQRDPVLRVDILPREFPGPPWMVEPVEAAKEIGAPS